MVAGAATSPPLLLKMSLLEPVKWHATSCFYFLRQRLQVLLGNCRCGVKSPAVSSRVADSSISGHLGLCSSCPHAVPLTRLPSRPESKRVRSRWLGPAAFFPSAANLSLRFSSLCSLAASLPVCNPLVFISLPKYVTVPLSKAGPAGP